MSNEQKTPDQDCDYSEGCHAVELLIHPKDKDLGGFSVRRVLPSLRYKKVGPWVFFDHLGPVVFPAGEGVNVRPHPHINLATVSYLFEGEIFHRDSLGNGLPIKPGDVNLMVSGRGVVHSERERPEYKATDHPLHGLQLWLALPAVDEEIDPAFYHYPSGDIPALNVDDVPVRIMMGTAYGVTSPVKTFAETLYIEARLAEGQSLVLPDAPERAVYVLGGEVKVGNTLITEHTMAVLSSPASLELHANKASIIVLVGGEVMSQRYMEWNFVSSRKERIEQAKQDWRNQRFAKVSGDDQEFIPLPGE
ncbi:MAG: pirin family protein [Parahaliea sp.]